jgi:hypothetical membrane protein
VVSAFLAPVLLVSGWTVAADLQPQFDPVRDPVSLLAAVGATDRWVMSLTFVVVGLCDAVTALALRPARRAGRALLIAGSVAGMVVAAYPENLRGGFGSVPHFVLGFLGFALLTFWPLAAARPGPGQPWALRPGPAGVVVAVQVALLAWFAAELITAAGQAGLAERIIGAAQALWPLAVVLSARLAAPDPALAGPGAGAGAGAGTGAAANKTKTA